MTSQNSWNNSLPVGANVGGTGFQAYVSGDLLVGTPAAKLAKLSLGTDGSVLTADSTQANGIKWAAASGGSSGGTLPVSGGGTGATSIRQNGIVIGQGTDPLQATTLDYNGQFLIGRQGGVPTAGGIYAADSSIAIDNQPGNIVIGASPWFTEVQVADNPYQQIGYNSKIYIVGNITSGIAYIALDCYGSQKNRECKIISSQGAKFKVGISTSGSVSKLIFGTMQITDGNTFFTSRGLGDSLTLYNYGNTTWIVTASTGNFDLTTT